MYLETSFSLHLSVVHISSVESLLVGDTNSTQTMANSDFPALSYRCSQHHSTLAATYYAFPCLVPETHSHTLFSIVQIHVSVEETVDSYIILPLPESPLDYSELLLTLDMVGWYFSLPCPLTTSTSSTFSIKMWLCMFDVYFESYFN